MKMYLFEFYFIVIICICLSISMSVLIQILFNRGNNDNVIFKKITNIENKIENLTFHNNENAILFRNYVDLCNIIERGIILNYNYIELKIDETIPKQFYYSIINNYKDKIEKALYNKDGLLICFKTNTNYKEEDFV